MKYILILLLLNSSVVCLAQNARNNLIKASVSKGFGPEQLNINTFELEYQRHIGIGVNMIIGYSKSNGGTSVKNLITDFAYNKLTQVDREFEFMGVGNGFLGDYFDQTRFKLGVQKNIKMTHAVELGLSLVGAFTSTSETEMVNIAYDSEGFLLVEEIDYLFSSYNKAVAEIGIHLQTQINTYMNFGVSVKYITNYKLISPCFFMGVNF